MTTKFTQVPDSCCVISASCRYGVVESSKENPLTIDSNSGYPSSVVPMHSFIRIFSIFTLSPVLTVFGVATFSEIISAVIKCIVISVVSFFGPDAVKYKSMHSYVSSLYSVIRLGSGTKPRLPVPLIKPFIVPRIYKRILSLRKSNEAVRLVRWLGDFVSRNMKFRHESSTKGFVLPSHFTICGEFAQ